MEVVIEILDGIPNMIHKPQGIGITIFEYDGDGAVRLRYPNHLEIKPRRDYVEPKASEYTCPGCGQHDCFSIIEET